MYTPTMKVCGTLHPRPNQILIFGVLDVSWTSVPCRYLIADCWFGPVVSVLQKFLPPRAR